MTLFSAFMVYDLRRQEKAKPELFGLFCCKHDSVLCCRGKFVTNSQRRFLRAKGIESCLAPSDDSVEENSFTEKFLYDKYSTVLLSKMGRIGVILLFLSYIAINAWGMTNLEIEFKPEWMIPPGAYVQNFIDLREEHFSTLGDPALFITQDPAYEQESV